MKNGPLNTTQLTIREVSRGVDVMLRLRRIQLLWNPHAWFEVLHSCSGFFFSVSVVKETFVREQENLFFRKSGPTYLKHFSFLVVSIFSKLRKRGWKGFRPLFKNEIGILCDLSWKRRTYFLVIFYCFPLDNLQDLNFRMCI